MVWRCYVQYKKCHDKLILVVYYENKWFGVDSFYPIYISFNG